MYSNIYREDYTLFDYQSKSKKMIFEAWDKHDSVLFQMPTGTGKTRLFTSLVRDLSYWSESTNARIKVLIIAHRKELIDQIDVCLSKYQIKHGKIVGGHNKDFNQSILVASIQTLSQSRKREEYRALDANFIIIDEAHHSIAPTYKKLWDLFPDAKFLGVTATPWSMTREGFDSIYGDIILSLQPREFIKINRLAPYDYYSIKDSNDIYKSIHQIHEYDHDGDYTRNALEKRFDNISIRAKLLDSYLKLVKGKKGIIYSICRSHSKHICEEFSNAGIRITDIDGDTPKSEREYKVNEFKRGNIDVLVNVDIFSEGFDCPDIEFIQLARPTRSLVKYIQQVGRGLRISKNKNKCIILDNVGALYDFGLPDIDRDWIKYFHGQKQVQTENKASFIELGNEKQFRREVNMDEGHEEMVKIVSASITGDNINNEEDHTSSSIDNTINKNKLLFLKRYGKTAKRH